VLPEITARAVDFVERAAAGDAPFFLYFALTAPHTPWVPTRPFQGRTEVGYYGDFVAQVDHSIGRVLEALEEADILDDTLVVVTSDNGSHWPEEDIVRHGHDANLGYRGQKADIWEGGHRVPFVVRWPGRVPEGAERSELLSLTDLFATFAALLAVEVPGGAAEDSIDQSGVWLGKELDAPPRASMVQHSMDGHFALRRGPWKLIPSLGSGGFTHPAWRLPDEGEPPGQLYHLGDDPGERKNLWAARPEVVASMLEALEAARR
jgi:arylsulfatase A-like enzyme